MGCTSSVYANIGKKKKSIPEVSVFVPVLRIPVQSDIQRRLRGSAPIDLAQRITSLRNQIVLIAENNGGTAYTELQNALEEYLPLVLGLAKKDVDSRLQELVEFKWKELHDSRQEFCATNSWFEVVFVFHMMSVLMLMEANYKLIPKENSLSERLVSAECMRDAIDLLLKAAGCLNFCVHDLLVLLPPDIKKQMPKDMQGGVLEAISHQALSQGTELQLSLAVLSQNVSFSVKRRLACEQLSFYAQAHYCIFEVDNTAASGKKQSLFLKWKYLEAKSAAYYYHGLILEKGSEPTSHITAVCCFLAAEQVLAESKKACLTFCLAQPITRVPPAWGAMKYLNKKIPETASKKSQMYGYLLDQNKDLQILPDLPEFQLSLKPEDYELPEVDPAWDCGKWDIPDQQTLKEHLNDSDAELTFDLKTF